jgi:FlaA1/EpsC-like NDP-sugar epimerase
MTTQAEFFQGRNVLITGGLSFIGSALAAGLEYCGFSGRFGYHPRR